MMSRITIHLKREGNRLDDGTTLSPPHTLVFNRGSTHRQSFPSQLFDHPFGTSTPELAQLSADKTPLPLGPSSINDIAGHVSFKGHHDLVHKPPPPIIAPSSNTSYIEVV